MPKPPVKRSAVNRSGLQDDDEPSDIGQQSQEGASQFRDERGQEQAADNERAQQSTGTPQVSQTGQNSGYSSGARKKSEA